MKIILQLLSTIILLSITLLYANSNIYNVKEDKPDVGQVLDRLNFSNILDEEIEKIKQDKVKEDLLAKREEIKRENRPKVSRSVPLANTSMKTYMDYRKITNKSSVQYKLQQRDDVWTDEEGFRRLGDKFMVACGTYYGQAGTELQIVLENGTVFDAIMGDVKANAHTDSQNRQHAKDGSVVEFLVSTKDLDSTIRKMGDCSYSSVNNFKGNIVDIIILYDDEE